MNQSKNILVFGGSAFIGKQLLQQLPSKVLIINRGKKYWNYEAFDLPNVERQWGDRSKTQDLTKLLKYLNKKHKINSQNKWDAIIDFSCFKPSQLIPIIVALQGLFQLYIFISTDSVYEVSDKNFINKNIGTVEQCCIRPNNQELYKKLIEKQQYGHVILYQKEKLLCQELIKQKDRKKFPYVIFRLPDVIGPYDDSGRLWAYIKWFQQQNQIVQIQKDTQDFLFSLVFSKDIAKIIVSLIYNPSQQKINQTYNLCFQKPITIYQLLSKIVRKFQKAELIGKPNYQFNIKQDAIEFLPSISYGFMNNDKAKKLLGWKPTDIVRSQLQNIAIQETVKFFLQKGQKYAQECKYAYEKLMKKLKMK